MLRGAEASVSSSVNPPLVAAGNAIEETGATISAGIFNRRGDLTIWLTNDKAHKMASFLKGKSYALEILPYNKLNNEAGDVGAILRLNEAGRRTSVSYG
jgi:hypothetical protein